LRERIENFDREGKGIRDKIGMVMWHIRLDFQLINLCLLILKATMLFLVVRSVLTSEKTPKLILESLLRFQRVF
jgi:hypothetical protein